MEKRRRRRRDSEEEIKPKRVRGSRTSDSKEVATINNTPTRKRKEKTALEIHDYDSTLRLQSYPDFRTLLDSKSLTNLIGACYNTGRPQLQRMIDDPRTTVGELQAIVLSTDAFDSESRSRMKAKEYSDNRLFGKVKDRIEHSGTGDGGAIAVQATKKFDMKNMTLQELKELDSVMDMLSTKTILENEEDDKDK